MTRVHAFGSSYYPPHHDRADWARDLDRMYGAGQRVIRTAELLASWDRLEVAKHVYDWSWLDEVFDLVEERGMQVLLGTGSQNPPIWMIEEHPDLPWSPPTACPTRPRPCGRGPAGSTPPTGPRSPGTSGR